MGTFSRIARLSVTALCALIAVLPRGGFGQAVYGSIYGTVTDPSGGAVPNAKITITDVNKNTKFETTTNADGNYSRTQLIPGTYQVEVEAPGFAKAVNRNITVSVDTATKVDVTMEVGTVATEVEVTAAAPLLKSDRSDVAVTFSAKALNDCRRLDATSKPMSCWFRAHKSSDGSMPPAKILKAVFRSK